MEGVLEKVIKKDGNVFKITIFEHKKEVWKSEYYAESKPIYKVYLYKKRDNKKWYHLSDYVSLGGLEFEKSEWVNKYKEMAQYVLERYEQKLLKTKKVVTEKQQAIQELKEWDGSTKEQLRIGEQK